MNALCREISKYNDSIDTVYFGGGTPSLMDGVELKKVLDTVYRSFNVAEDAEITLEANPMTLTEESKLYEFRKLGINRLSIGVQSFSDTELTALGRGHTAKEAADTVKAARNAGFDNISVDLMFAIPHQTLKSFEESLDMTISLGADHVSVYALSIEEKTVFGVKQRRGDDLMLPNEDEEAEMYFLACRKLREADYEHYEISNFGKAKHRSRHNMKYWHGEEYIGLGAAAHSYYKGTRYSTPRDINAFCEEAKKEDVYSNTPEDRAEEAVFLSLRLSDGLDMDRLLKEHGVKPSDSFDKTVSDLVRQGFCLYDGRVLSLTEKGFFVSNTIILKIFDSLQFTP